MILRLQTTKIGKIRFASHRDIAKVWERSLRRAEIPLVYSEGFSPRPKIAFGLALPTGAGILSSRNERRKKWHGPVIASLGALSFEVIGFGILSLIPKIPELTPLIYFHILLTIFICLLFIIKQPKLNYRNILFLNLKKT